MKIDSFTASYPEGGLEWLTYRKIEELEGYYTHPERQYDDDAGIDLPFNPIDGQWVNIPAGATRTLGTGFVFDIPQGTVGMVCSRSGLAANRGLHVLNAPGIIDSGYRGELKVILHNTSNAARVFSPGDRIAQLLVMPILTPPLLYVAGLTERKITDVETTRGTNGFGSTGN